jgi:hypothetical protein
VCSNDNARRRNVRGKRDRLAVRIVGLIGAVAEGPVAIGGLVLIVLVLVLFYR